MDKLVFTPSAVLALLSEVEELDSYDIEFEESSDSVDISINGKHYILAAENAEEINIDETSLDAISDANNSGYDELQDNQNIVYEEDAEPVEGGIIKELVKTLAVGGLVRLTSKAIKHS